MHRAITINFKYSNIFAFRAICKHCGEGPSRAYFIMNKDLSQENFKFLLKRKPTLNTGSIIQNNKFVEMLVKHREFKPTYLFNRDAATERSVFVPNSKFEPSEN